MRHRTRSTGLFTIVLFAIFLSGRLGTPCQAVTHNTNDGLVLSINASGQTVSLTVGGEPIAFSPGDLGGFYIRDNSLLPSTNLPDGGNNLIDCPGFQDAGGVECLLFSDWNIIRPDPPEFTAITSEEPINGSDDYVAQVTIDEDPDLSLNAHWAILRQDVELELNPTTNDLYYLIFEVATESGWRPITHPDNYVPDQHGAHKIFGRVEWFNGVPGSVGTESTAPHPDALAVSTIDAYETTYYDPDAAGPEEDKGGMTRFSLRTHRPVVPTQATHARISLVVEGYLPDDGVEDPVLNHVWFDNVYFFKAPDAVPAVNFGTSEGAFQPLAGLPYLSMWVDVSVVNGKYIRFDGALKNNAPGSIPRALDLGYALPIKDEDGSQDVTWYDDARHGYDISATVPSAANWIPYRFTAPADQRASTDLYWRQPSALTEINTRAENNQLSIYPFSAIDVIFQSGLRRGISFGDNQLDSGGNPADPPVAHFGYRIERSGSGANFRGKYYVEFNLGLLEQGTPGQNVTPFSFILFRSDIPAIHETSSFRLATEKYQTDFFPSAFSRPDHLPLADDWLFGGGIFSPHENGSTWWDKGFTHNPNEFGLRYTRVAAVSTEDPDARIQYGLDHNVRVLIYDRPWTGAFKNGIIDHERNTYNGLVDEASSFDNGPIFWAKKFHTCSTPCRFGQETHYTTIFSRYMAIEAGSEEDYNFPVLLMDLGYLAPDRQIIPQETGYYFGGYETYSMGSTNPDGFAGVLFDNAFNDLTKANHLDQTSERLAPFREAGGAPTYSMNNFLPAIPPVVANARFLDVVDATLATIDDPTESYDCGEGGNATENSTEELIGANLTQRDHGTIKYAMMKADVAGFESNAATAYNSSTEALALRRAMMRDKSMTRQLMEFPCLYKESDGSGILPDYDSLDPYDLFIDVNQLRVQLVNEVCWMSLTWGFLPGVSQYLPIWSNLSGDPTDNFYEFVDDYLRDLFNHTNSPGLGFTHIFKELHLAGWKPVTNVEIELRGGQDLNDLYWERFGGGPVAGPANPSYVTVLNNRNLEFTFVELFENNASLLNPQLPPLKSFETVQQLRDSNQCTTLFSPAHAPADCGEVNFRARDKDIKVKIFNANYMGLWAYNIYGVQLVGYEPPADLCNAPTIVADHIYEGSTGSDVLYTIKREAGGTVTIGGPWPTGEEQQELSIPDKALMVFKLYSSNIVSNGATGGGGESGRSGEGGEESLISAYYERYGQGWSRTESYGGHEGNVDTVLADSPGAAAYFKVHAGYSGRYAVQVQFPPMAEAADSALYEVFLTGYMTSPAGSAMLGEPLISAVVDQSDAESYDSAHDLDNFVTLGELDISVGEEQMPATVVVKLSSPGEESDRQIGSPGLLLADAVRLARIE